MDSSATAPTMTVKFNFSQEKALAALAFIASTEEGLSPLFVAKVLFFAEKSHINAYGRPILGDTFIAMPRGPVPSTIKNYIDERWDWVERPDGFDAVVKIVNRAGLRRLERGTDVGDMTLLSETDKQALRDAIAFCNGKSANHLSDLTHFERAWMNAPANRPMDYEDFVDDDNPHRGEIIESLREYAAYGVL